MMERLSKNSSKTAYWNQKLDGATKVTPFQLIPSDHSTEMSMASLDFEIEEDFSRSLNEVAKSKDLNLFKLFLTGLNFVLSKYSPLSDLTVTTSSIDLDGKSVTNPALIFFRLNLDDNESSKSLLKKIHIELTEVLKYQDYDFQEWKKLNEQEDLTDRRAGVGLFYEGINTWSADFNETSCFLKIKNIEGKLQFSINYYEDLYSEKAIRLFGSHILRALELMTVDLEKELTQINFITNEDTLQIDGDFNNTAKETLKQSLVEQFEEQVAKTPENIALLFGQKELTYIELNEKANQLANYLISEQKVTPGDFVGIKLARTEWLIISILAVLKTGSTYVPVDVNYPAERIKYIQEDSNCQVMLDQAMLQDFNNQIDQFDKGNSTMIIDSDNIAYIIYTSGTTGKPKGVMISHQNAVELVNWSKEEYAITSFEVVYAATSHCFDLSVYEIFFTLAIGKKIKLFNSALDIGESLKEDSGVMINTVPSVMRSIVAAGYTLRNVAAINLAGEPFPEEILEEMFENKDIHVRNLWGPSEDTTYSTSYLLKGIPWKSQPIGKPMTNTQVHILNDELEQLPIGVIGEAYLSGAGVTKGYLNKEELTKEKYLVNPMKNSIGEVLYKSGDLLRWLPDGKLEIFGRIDDQVKIRGYRIELGEVETHVSKLQYVEQAVVIVQEAEIGNKQLVAYLRSDIKLDPQQLRNELEQIVPGYMIPAYFVQLEQIPLTPNGKTDKKALPDPADIHLDAEQTDNLPQTETEKGVHEIWEGLLDATSINTDASFFEVGGHSLKATQMIAKIHKQFNVKLSLKDIFIAPTIAGLAELIDSNQVKEDFQQIETVERQASYKLSHAQQRMWLTGQIQEDQTIYNMPYALRIGNQVDIESLNKAFLQVIERHEILRTIFITENGEPRQKILSIEASDFEVRLENLTNLSFDDPLITKITEREAATVFQLDKKPPLTACLLQLANRESLLLFTMHHIISDGWSMEVLTNELLMNYEAITNNQKHELAPLRIQYKDFANWQHNLLQEESTNTLKTYWNDKFAGELSTLELPVDFTRPIARTYAGNTQKLQLSQELSKSLSQVANEKDATLFMVLTALVKTLLYRYTGQTDMIVGTPIAGREHSDLSNQIGFFVNTLAIRNTIDGESQFTTLLESVKQNLLEAYQHQAYPFDKLVEDLQLVQEKGHAPLFDVMVALQNNEEVKTEQFTASNLEVSSVESPYQFSKYDLTFSFHEGDEGIVLELEYSTELFAASRIERLLGHFQQMIQSILENGEQSIDQIKFLTFKEESELLNQFAGKVEKLPNRITVPSLFSEISAMYPDQVAIVDEQQSLTYSELNQRANQLANLLINQFRPDLEESIGIVMSRKADFIIAMLAILKSGCSYLPIDVSNVPVERISYLLDKVQANIFITDDEKFTKQLTNQAGIVLSNELLDPQSTIGPEVEGMTTESLAYVMFTSGTTGNPKGAMITQQSIIRLVRDTNYTQLDAQDRILQTGSLSFDAATFEIWGALLNGGKLFVKTLDNLLDLNKLTNTILENGITKMWFTSSWFNQLVDLNVALFEPLKQILVGGEKLSAPHIKKVKDAFPEIRITNGYGPTENTTFSICGDVVTASDNIPLGRPISQSTVHILDKNLQLVPKGVVGEIMLGGIGLSTGYINDAIRTAEKFINNPFDEGSQLYHSGDLGRWLEDGQIEFLGRVDDQVKINGFRIEPGEVTNVLVGHEAIKEAVVTVFEKENGSKALAAYYVLNNEINQTNLRSYLESKLPAYMVPLSMMQLESIPLNVNGKVDRKLLPSPVISTEAAIKPINQTEELIANIWTELLGIHEISMDANFFAMGGNSLIAMKAISRIQVETGCSLSIATIFQNPTIKQLAGLIETTEKGSYEEIPAIASQELYEVSQAQKRIWIADLVAADRSVYNITMGFEIKGNLDVDRLRNAILRVIDRHEILRTNFVENDGLPFQKINLFDEKSCDFSIIETNDLLGDSKMILSGEEAHEFDLENDALIRFRLVTEGDRNAMIVNMHHIIGDGWSIAVLQNDVLAYYHENNELASLSIQYKDYAQWHNETLEEKQSEAEKYWLNSLAGIEQRSDLPIDKNRATVRSTESRQVEFSLGKEISSWIQDIANQNGAGQFIVLQTLVKLYLRDFINSSDIVIGTPVAGRNHPQLEQQIGFYVNMLALRTKIEEDVTFQELLDQLVEETKYAFEYQAYPYDAIVNKLGLSRDLSRNQLFDVVISYLDGLEGSEENSELRFDGFETNDAEGQNKYDITYSFVTEESGEIIATITYNHNLFFESSIQNMKQKMIQLFEEILKSPNKPVNRLFAPKPSAFSLLNDLS